MNSGTVIRPDHLSPCFRMFKFEDVLRCFKVSTLTKIKNSFPHYNFVQLFLIHIVRRFTTIVASCIFLKKQPHPNTAEQT